MSQGDKMIYKAIKKSVEGGKKPINRRLYSFQLGSVKQFFENESLN